MSADDLRAHQPAACTEPPADLVCARNLTVTSGSFLALELELSETTNLTVRFDQEATWEDPVFFFYRLLGEGSNGEGFTSVRAATAAGNCTADAAGLPQCGGGAFRGSRNTEMSNTLPAGTYVPIAAAFGATQAVTTIGIEVDKPIRVGRWQNGSAQQVTIAPEPESHSGSTSVHVTDEAWLVVRSQGGRAMSSVSIEGTDGAERRFTPFSSAPAWVVPAHWNDEGEEQLADWPNLAAVRGATTIDVTWFGPMTTGTTALVGVLHDPFFVSDEGRLTSYGPGYHL